MLLPDHETAVDFLNYEAISKTVVGLLRENRKHALTIGIHGDWGAGKSSVLKMIETEISKDGAVACLWFNGWTFQGFDDAKTVLIESTISELSPITCAVKDARVVHRRRTDRSQVVSRVPNIFSGIVCPHDLLPVQTPATGELIPRNTMMRKTGAFAPNKKCE